VLNFGLAKLFAPHRGECCIHLYEMFMLRSRVADRRHNTWSEWQLIGGGSESIGKKYLFMFDLKQVVSQWTGKPRVDTGSLYRDLYKTVLSMWVVDIGVKPTLVI